MVQFPNCVGYYFCGKTSIVNQNGRTKPMTSKSSNNGLISVRIYTNNSMETTEVHVVKLASMRLFLWHSADML